VSGPQRLRERVIYEKNDVGVATMTLDFAEKANLQDHDMVWAFDEALDLAEADYDIKVVVIKANGKGFCSGHVGTGVTARHHDRVTRRMVVTRGGVGCQECHTNYGAFSSFVNRA
jgi:enoyl-CoA hydratase/carnithine racemase